MFQCHSTRSLETNQKLARVRLQERLDWFYNRENSLAEQDKREAGQKKREREKRTRERLEKLRAFKEREGLDWAALLFWYVGLLTTAPEVQFLQFKAQVCSAHFLLITTMMAYWSVDVNAPQADDSNPQGHIFENYDLCSCRSMLMKACNKLTEQVVLKFKIYHID